MTQLLPDHALKAVEAQARGIQKFKALALPKIISPLYEALT